jgi:hypothetical protein
LGGLRDSVHEFDTKFAVGGTHNEQDQTTDGDDAKAENSISL